MVEERSAPAIGFDLDLTLIDARPGMVRAMGAVNAEFGTEVDAQHFAANLGPPLDHVLRGYGFDEPLIERMVAHFRAIYPTVVIGDTVALPGAEESLEAVRDRGARSLVITGKYEPNAALHLKALGWEVDRLAGEVFAEAKGDVLRAEGATIYVGDHHGDIAGAKAAGALAVGVATGPYTAGQLRELGADVVLGELTEFPAWLAENA